MRYVLKNIFIACFATFVLTYFFFSIYELSLNIKEWEEIVRHNFAGINLAMSFIYLFVIILSKEN